MEEHYLKKELYDLVKKDSRIFEFLQSGSLDGIWYWDLEKPEHEWMSPRFWENFGYDPKEKKHLASEWQTMINQDDLKMCISNFEKHKKDPNRPYDQIVRYTKKDGSIAWIRCRGLAIRDKNGTPIRMLGAHNDVTTLKETEASLHQKLNELEQLNKQMIGREVKMDQLKKEVDTLLKELGRDKKYT
ncbi:diguanylate cyclase [bacterium]|nr:diguanylate cyclase [bacterium]|tara:strand:+ start:6618 stop:7178 length:561 start_codon:yes stop_codon:yes gene_type:complete